MLRLTTFLRFAPSTRHPGRTPLLAERAPLGARLVNAPPPRDPRGRLLPVPEIEVLGVRPSLRTHPAASIPVLLNTPSPRLGPQARQLVGNVSPAPEVHLVGRLAPERGVRHVPLCCST